MIMDGGSIARAQHTMVCYRIVVLCYGRHTQTETTAHSWSSSFALFVTSIIAWGTSVEPHVLLRLPNIRTAQATFRTAAWGHQPSFNAAHIRPVDVLVDSVGDLSLRGRHAEQLLVLLTKVAVGAIFAVVCTAFRAHRTNAHMCKCRLGGVRIEALKQRDEAPIGRGGKRNTRANTRRSACRKKRQGRHTATNTRRGHHDHKDFLVARSQHREAVHHSARALAACANHAHMNLQPACQVVQ